MNAEKQAEKAKNFGQLIQVITLPATECNSCWPKYQPQTREENPC